MSDNGNNLSTNSTYRPTDGWNPVLLRSDIDQVLDVLSHRYRRAVLLLLTHDAVTTVEDVRRQGDEEIGEIELIHTHLPKLETEGYIEWNQETGEIFKGPCFDTVKPLLDVMERNAEDLLQHWP